MKYVSTRGDSSNATLFDVLLDGLAPDGGLYLPKSYPQLSQEQITGLAGMPYHEAAKVVLEPYIKEETKGQFSKIVEGAYKDKFGHPAVTPLTQIDSNQFVLELFHGPTMSFKDIAMQFLAPLMDCALTKKRKRISLIGATSGDTGSAAIHAFQNNKNADIFVLFPEGKISNVQKWQMTGVTKRNVHPIAIKGTFDDCQNIVKELLADENIKSRCNLAPVNSINWGRIIAQTVYYFVAAANLGARPVNFVVPTGNFGDIFAGYVAKKMGLNIDRLVIATNNNDILVRTLKTGVYETRRVVPTTSPSMDIQVSSNFERLLYEASGRDETLVKISMIGLSMNGRFVLGDEITNNILREFDAGTASLSETKKQIKKLYKDTNYLVDPHTAVGVHVAQSVKSDNPTIILGTASPQKFPEATKEAVGVNVTRHPKPKKENMVRVDNEVGAVAEYILKNSKAGK